MKRKIITIFMVMLTLSIILTGCGTSDKFVGKWIGTPINAMDGTKNIQILEIKKNGEGNAYLITATKIHYNKLIYYFTDSSFKDGDAINWKIITSQTVTAIGNQKNNTLTIDGGFGSTILFFNEADKTLNESGNHTSYQKDPEGKLLENFANELQAERQQIMKKNFPDKNITVEGYAELKTAMEKKGTSSDIKK